MPSGFNVTNVCYPGVSKLSYTNAETTKKDHKQGNLSGVRVYTIFMRHINVIISCDLNSTDFDLALLSISGQR